MKLTESRIKEIIFEELRSLSEAEQEQNPTPKPEKFGSKMTSSSQRTKGLKQGASDVSKQQGIDPKEYGIMDQVEEILQDLANLTDIKTGKVITVLNPVFKKLTAIRDELKQQAKK